MFSIPLFCHRETHMVSPSWSHVVPTTHGSTQHFLCVRDKGGGLSVTMFHVIPSTSFAFNA